MGAARISALLAVGLGVPHLERAEPTPPRRATTRLTRCAAFGDARQSTAAEGQDDPREVLASALSFGQV
jgi:hypothetical protein